MRSIGLRRIAYYALVLGGAIAVHQGAVESLHPELASLLRRNNEGYALMLLPAYWDLFAGTTDPRGTAGRRPADPPWGGQVLWFSVLASLALLLPSRFLGALPRLSQSIVTLREAVVALLLVSAYLGWSRGIGSWHREEIDGTPVVSRAARSTYYVSVAVVAFAVDAGWVRAAAAWLGTWLEPNIEAFAAMLLIPAYFDLVAPSRSLALRFAWLAILVAVPVLVYLDVLDGIVWPGLLDWTSRSTEAFLAALVISVYFGWWRDAPPPR
jgi:hypothetical protein